MKDKIIILDGSERLHINTTLKALDEIKTIRGIDQDVWKSWDISYINPLLAAGYNPQRDQVDIFRLGQEFMRRDWLHNQNRDWLKILITDKGIYDSRINGLSFGFGVTFPFSDGNKYIIVSTANLGNEGMELHAGHVLMHEIGHAFGAPNSARLGVYNSLGIHCPDSDCTMHQELTGESSYNQAIRVARNGVYFCPSCTEDIRRY